MTNLLQFIGQEMTLTCPICGEVMTVQPSNNKWLECCKIVEMNPNTNRYFNNDEWKARIKKLQLLKKEGYYERIKWAEEALE